MAALSIDADICLWFRLYLFYFYLENCVMAFLLVGLYLDSIYRLFFSLIS